MDYGFCWNTAPRLMEQLAINLAATPQVGQPAAASASASTDSATSSILGWMAGNWPYMLLALLLLLVVGLLIFFLVSKIKQWRKSKSEGDSTADNSEREALRNRIAEIDKRAAWAAAFFKKAGKDLYEAPWYLVVGEPGAGKSEMIRHCGLSFMPEIDLSQGCNGTDYFDWWLSRDSVLIDASGKLFLSQRGLPDDIEWRHLLSTLRRMRPRLPINGVLVSLPCDALLADAEQLTQKKAKLISEELGVMQSMFGLNIPVYLVITKIDHLPGFRDYCAQLPGEMSNQILGWSNPSDKGTYDVDAFAKQFDIMLGGLSEKRPTLLLSKGLWDIDPRHSRANRASTLYGFPDAIAELKPALLIYLRSIFSVSQWSGRNLLMLRGVYMCSAQDKGVVFDTAAARQLGKKLDEASVRCEPVDSVPRFIGELFTAKILPEAGRAFFPSRMVFRMARPHIAFSCILIACALFLLFSARMNEPDLEDESQSHVNQWKAAHQLFMADAVRKSPMVDDEAGESIPVFYKPMTDMPGVTRGDFLRRLAASSADPFPLPFNFLLASNLSGRFGVDYLKAERQGVYYLAFTEMFFVPLLDAARYKFMVNNDSPWGAKDTAALIVLLDIEDANFQRQSAGLVERVKPFSINSLSFFVFTKGFFFDPNNASQTSVGWRFNPTNPESDVFHMLQSGAPRSREAIQKAFNRFFEKWVKEEAHREAQFHEISRFCDLLEQYVTIEGKVLTLRDEFTSGKGLQAMSPHLSILARDKWLALSAELLDTAGQIEKINGGILAAGRLRLIEMVSQSSDEFLKIMGEEFAALDHRLALCEPKDDSEFFSRLRSSLKTVRDSVKTKVQDDTNGRVARIDTLLRIMWSPVDDAPPPRDYQTRTHLYSTIADASLPRNPIDTIMSLTDVIRQSVGNIKNCEKMIADLRQSKPNAYMADFLSTCSCLVDLTRQVNSQEILTSVVRICPDSVVDYMDLVANAARKTNPVTLDNVPLTAINDRFQTDPSFHPEVVKRLTIEMAELRKQIDQSAVAGAASTLDLDSASRYDRIGSSLKKYLSKYIEYWSSKVDELASVRPFANWQDFLNQTNSIKAYEVNSTVADLYGIAADAILSPSYPAGSPQEAEAKTRVAWYRSKLSLLNDLFSQASAATLASWCTLPPIPQEAHSAIASMSREQILVGLLAAYSGDDKSRINWWGQYVENATKCLKSELALFIQANVRKLSSALMCFPVCNTPNRDYILSPDEIADACARIEPFLKISDLTAPPPPLPPSNLPVPAPKPAADPSGAGPAYSTLIPNMKMLELLKADALLDTPEKRVWWKKTREVINILNDEEKPLAWTIVVPSMKAQSSTPNSAVGWNLTPAQFRYRFFEVYSQGARLGKRMPTTMADGKPAAFPEVTDFARKQDLTLMFFENSNDTAATATASFNGPWGVMNMFLHDDVWLDDDAKAYMVPMYVVDNSGHRCFYWTGIRFDRPVPPPSYWPTMDDWIDFSPISGTHIRPAEMTKMLFDLLRQQTSAGDAAAAINKQIVAKLEAAAPFGTKPLLRIYVPTLRDQERKPVAMLNDNIRFDTAACAVPNSGSSLARYFELYVNGKRLGVRLKTATDDGLEKRDTGMLVPLVDGDVEFRFYSFADSTDPIKTITFKGPYAALNLLHSRHRAKNAKDSTYLVPLFLQANDGENFYYWIGMDVAYSYMTPPDLMRDSRGEATR